MIRDLKFEFDNISCENPKTFFVCRYNFFGSTTSRTHQMWDEEQWVGTLLTFTTTFFSRKYCISNRQWINENTTTTTTLSFIGEFPSQRLFLSVLNFNVAMWCVIQTSSLIGQVVADGKQRESELLKEHWLGLEKTRNKQKICLINSIIHLILKFLF